MDLSRAKTVLILAFLALNLFLGYQLWLEGGVTALTYVQRESELSRLEVALQEAGITLTTPLPRGAVRISHLVVEPVLLPRQEVLNIFFPDPEGLVLQRLEQDVHYWQNGRRLIFYPGGLVSFRTNPPEPVLELNQEEALLKAQKFLEGVGAAPYLKLDCQLRLDVGWKLLFAQEYESFPLFGESLQMVIQGDHISSVELYLVEPLGFSGQEREIIQVSTALLRFLEEYGDRVEGTAIIDLTLGFYSTYYNAERWEIPPVWRIRFNNGEVFYINAFTGYPEAH